MGGGGIRGEGERERLRLSDEMVWVEVGVESSKWYASERMVCDRQGRQTSKQNNSDC